jgi:CBS domain containing-hemolysin-like protein
MSSASSSASGILAGKHIQVALSHPGTLQALVFGAVAASLVTVVGVGLAGVIRHTAGAVTALAMLILGGAVFGQMVPAGLRQYIPGIAVQAAVTVHRSAGLLRPGAAVLVLCAYAAVALGAASVRMAHRDA